MVGRVALEIIMVLTTPTSSISMVVLAAEEPHMTVVVRVVDIAVVERVNLRNLVAADRSIQARIKSIAQAATTAIMGLAM